MSIDFCNLCGDPCTGKNPWIGNNNSQETWRTLIAQALCGLAGNIPGVADAVPLPQFSATAAVLTSTYATYASPSFIDTALTLRRLRIVNKTDADIEISFDGGATTYARILANTEVQLDVGKQVFDAATDFKIRIASGMTATLSSLYIEGGY